MTWEQLLAALLVLLVTVSVFYFLWRSHRQTSVYRRVEDFSAQLNELTLRVVELELALSGERLHNSVLRGQLIEAGITPAPPPDWLMRMIGPGRTEPLTPGAGVLVQVYHLINETFNSDEMDDLIFRAGFPRNEIGGDTPLSKARAIVEYAGVRRRLPHLINVLSVLRPDEDWPRVGG